MDSPFDLEVHHLRLDERFVAFSSDLVAELSALCDRVEDDIDTKPVLFEIGSVRTLEGADHIGVHEVNKWEQVLRRVERLPTLILAHAEGECSSTALDLLLVSDIRSAHPDTSFILPAVGGAPWPGMATHRLAIQIGAAAARPLTVWGQAMTAHRGLAVGLLDEISTDAHPLSAERAKQLSGKEIAIRRRLLLDAASTSFDDALGAHLSACDRALRQHSEAVV